MINYTFQFADLEYFLLIFVRLASFMFTAPFFSTVNTPRRVKAGFAAVVSVILFQVLTPGAELSYATVWGYGALAVKEALAGLIIGYGASVCNSIVIFSGRIVDMEIGLAMANVFDPQSKEQVSVTGQLFNYAVLLMLVISGMHRYILRAFIDSYQLIPVGGVVFHLDSLVNTFVRFMTDYVVIGFRICLPVFAVVLLVNAILGILAKVAPQMNMFSVGMQIKIIVGLGALFLVVGLLPNVADFIFREMKQMMVAFIQGMY